MFQSHAGTEFGLIKYFVHDKDTGEMYALMHIPEVTDSPHALRKFSYHHFWLSEERKSFMVVDVTVIEGKVFYLSGNKDNVCVARAPNIVERE
ncbi:hypothetical protein OS493_012901 [Desmophyllum pertusum]|uniref:Uncharacterized protein n=1 Tax=Desmophyllum pertusum TaxID=174260 RepID=A0A9W9Z1I2_9CNID|nr:hypothetical protein OS493_012901 [Desmophyllum pertusum]